MDLRARRRCSEVLGGAIVRGRRPQTGGAAGSPLEPEGSKRRIYTVSVDPLHAGRPTVGLQERCVGHAAAVIDDAAEGEARGGEVEESGPKISGVKGGNRRATLF